MFLLFLAAVKMPKEKKAFFCAVCTSKKNRRQGHLPCSEKAKKFAQKSVYERKKNWNLKEIRFKKIV